MSSYVRSRQVETSVFRPDDTDHCVDCTQQIIWMRRKSMWGEYDGKCGCPKRRWEMSPVSVKIERFDK